MRRYSLALLPAVLVALVAGSVALVGAEPASAHHALPGTVPGRDACTKRVEIVFWTANRHRLLMPALAADPAPCVDYYISVPPADPDMTQLRAGSVYRDIRDLGPQFHSLAEVRLGQLTGWARWVAAGNGTWYEAGVEFRRRMAMRGLQPEFGHTWLLNEFDYTTRRDEAVHKDGTSPGYPRSAMLDLVRGLYEGAPGMPPSGGVVEIGIVQSHQNLPDVPAYKEQMKAWLRDGAFWASLDGKIRWLAHEAYADTRKHGVPGSRLEERRQHLVNYQQHLIELVKAGGRRVLHARALFKETYMPFINGGGYVAPGGDAFDFEGGHGNTQVPLDQMMRFVSEQVNAVEFYAERHFDAAATQGIGFSWQPGNNSIVPNGPVPPLAEFEARVSQLAAHLAAVLAATYGPAGASKDACLRETGFDWCTMQRPDAEFTADWDLFTVW